MDYIKATVHTKADACELLADYMAPICGGCEVVNPQELQNFMQAKDTRWDYIDEGLFDIQNVRPAVNFYVSTDDEGARILSEIKELLAQLAAEDKTGFFGALGFEQQFVRGDDWQNNWKKYYKPMPVGRRLLIKPSWEAYEQDDGRVCLTIDPALSFGTGSHATTRLCLEALDGLDLTDKSMLDMGCGSGILSCAAALLGAKNITACDVEQAAVKTTIENLGINDMPQGRVTALCGDILADDAVYRKLCCAAPFDVICANIVAGVLIDMCEKLIGVLAPGGVVILSGIINEKALQVKDRYAQNLVLKDEKNCDGWTMLVFKKR